MVEFLREFGGLTVVYPHVRATGSEDNFVVSAKVAVLGRYAYQWVTDYNRRAGSKFLTPVGEAARGYLILMMDQSGRVLGGYDPFLAVIGGSGDEAIETLCSGTSFTEVP